MCSLLWCWPSRVLIFELVLIFNGYFLLNYLLLICSLSGGRGRKFFCCCTVNGFWKRMRIRDEWAIWTAISFFLSFSSFFFWYGCSRYCQAHTFHVSHLRTVSPMILPLRKRRKGDWKRLPELLCWNFCVCLFKSNYVLIRPWVLVYF